MKKSIKIVSMSEYHNSQSSPKLQLSTPRKALVQGTLDIVSPRSPVQSYDSPAAVSSSSSLVSSRHSYAEDQHATPRRARAPVLSMHAPPQPERPSTSLELSDDDAETPMRPFADASNVPRPSPRGREEEPAAVEEEEDAAAPFTVSLSEEENRRARSSEPVFKPPRTIKATSDVSKSSDSGGRAKSGSAIVTGTAKKKKKSGRVVESRYMQPPTDSRKLSASFSVTSVGMPLLNSTSLDCSHQSAASNESQTSARSRRPAAAASEVKPADPPGQAKRAPAKPKKSAAPASPAVRRLVESGPATSSGQEAQEELDFLHTLYMQYKFHNALASSYEERQRRQFEAEFGAVWDAYRGRQEKLVELRRELTYWQHVRSLEESITEQIAVLEPLLDAFPDFSRRFSSVSSALDSTRHQLALKDVVLPSPDRLREWQAELAADAGRAAGLLEEIAAASVPADSVERLAELVAHLREAKSRHQQLFGAARDIVARAARVFAEEASLRVHAYQRRVT